jgi:NAD(P)-dependent dehydrogenase (short-subunit alcohol dehydrogenase family)
MTTLFVVISLVLIIYVIYRLYQHLFPSPSIDPHNKYVLISGCDTGFGHTLAIELDKQGFHVLAGVYNRDNQVSLTNRLSPRATVFCLDITRQEDIDRVCNIVQNKTNTLHALVNNAGISSSAFIDWINVESMRKIMDVNFFGHVAMTKTFLPLLISKRDSRVVNITSALGIVSVPTSSAYCASKYALESFSDCLRREMSSWGLRVCIIEPGYMRTPLLEGRAHAIQQLWNGLSADVQYRWGEDFLNDRLKKWKNNVFVKNAENPDKVLASLQHAVTNKAPRIRYRPGWQSKFYFFPLSLLPAWLADLVMAKISGSGVLPAGVHKQLKE